MISVVTGSSAGVGRAAALAFARAGCDVALIARNAGRLEQAAAELRQHGVRALPIAADVADAEALDAAATRVEAELGPIDIWVNNAMATIFAPLGRITAAEFRRATEVTYLGQVYGTMAALAHMRTRDRGTIVNVGSALAYRAIPLQSAYCGGKYAVRGFTDSVRTELMHDGSKIRLVMVHLPAMNTPQFDWALNKMEKRAQPVPPIFQPEVAARAIAAMGLNPDRREMWVGGPTVMVILANKLAPGLLDRYFAKNGYSGQLTAQPVPADAPVNLFETADGDYGAHGRFDKRARRFSLEAFAARHRSATALSLVGLGCLGLAAFSALLASHKGAAGQRTGTHTIPQRLPAPPRSPAAGDNGRAADRSVSPAEALD